MTILIFLGLLLLVGVLAALLTGWLVVLACKGGVGKGLNL